MSVALTNCGRFGWTSDRHGYRYTRIDPDTNQPWPAMPDVFARLAHDAAADAGFKGFAPDACLVNRYLPGSPLSLHDHKKERDLNAPIVWVSVGIPVTFLCGRNVRSDTTRNLPRYLGAVASGGGGNRKIERGR